MISSKNNKDIFEESVQAFLIAVKDFDFCEASPISLVGKIVENRLPCILFSPRKVFFGSLWVARGEFCEF